MCNYEEEKPLYIEEEQKIMNDNFLQDKSLSLGNEEGRKAYSKVKGHSLLSGMVTFLGVILIMDFFWNEKKTLNEILEIFKILIFTLSGYLFGKNEKE